LRVGSALIGAGLLSDLPACYSGSPAALRASAIEAARAGSQLTPANCRL
jgi:hypothetical protein